MVRGVGMSAASQHGLAIATIVVFGVQGAVALGYLLYKTVGITVPVPGGVADSHIGDNSAKEIRNAVAAINTVKEEIKASNKDLSDKVVKLDAGVGELQRQLGKAGREAYFWNIANLLFGAAGVVIGIIAL